MAGTLTITGIASGLASGQKQIGPVTMTGVATVGQINDATLSSGDNTFTLPTGETVSAVVVFLPATSVATVKVRTNLDSGDTGVQVLPYAGSGVPFVVLPLPATTTSVILNASTSVAGVELTYI